MKGIWKGKYKFAGRVPESLKTRETQFEINIQSFDGSHFTGTVEDDLESGGTPGTGKVQGEISNDNISFVKQMPVSALYFKDKMIIDEKKMHPPIYYTGKISNGRAQGTWRFRFGIMFKGIIPFIILPTKGTWEMTQVD